MKNNYCIRQYETSYHTMEEAKSVCSAHSNCFGFFTASPNDTSTSINVDNGIQFDDMIQFHLCEFPNRIEEKKENNLFIKEHNSGKFQKIVLNLNLMIIITINRQDK